MQGGGEWSRPEKKLNVTTIHTTNPVKTKNNLISEDNTDIPVPVEIYETNTVATEPRSNLDTVTNKYGDNLLRLCKIVPLRICNGTMLGDILGSFTCITPNGQSCVDYCLASPNLYNSVRTLQVGDFIPSLSDHCPVTVTLKVNVNAFVDLSNYDFISKPPKGSFQNSKPVKSGKPSH